MRPLKPTLRDKKRYVVIETIAHKQPAMEAVFATVREQLKTLCGSLATAKARLKLITEKSTQARIIIRVHRDSVDALRAAVCLARIPDTQAVLRTIIVSGSLRKAAQSSQGGE